MAISKSKEQIQEGIWNVRYKLLNHNSNTREVKENQDLLINALVAQAKTEAKKDGFATPDAFAILRLGISVSEDPDIRKRFVDVLKKAIEVEGNPIAFADIYRGLKDDVERLGRRLDKAVKDRDEVLSLFEEKGANKADLEGNAPTINPNSFQRK